MSTETLLLHLQRNSGIPLPSQIINEFTRLIELGVLPAGSRLPSSRNLADTLGVNRTTVYRAYEELSALGYIDSRPGSYTTVRIRPVTTLNAGAGSAGRIDWRSVSTTSADVLHAEYETQLADAPRPDTDGFISFVPLQPDTRLSPVGAFRACMNRVLLDEGPSVLSYGEPAGYGPLRDFIAQRLQRHGIATERGEIILTHGAQHALQLILALLVESGDGVVVESPTYSNFLPLLRASRACVTPVSMQPEGMDLRRLKAVVKRKRPACVYTIPNFHNPTGITSTQSHREELLTFCEREAIPIVEDGFEEEMKYNGKVPLPIKSMDRTRIVLYVGTFSKVLFPGLRLGWIAADRGAIRRLTAMVKFGELAGNTLTQAAMNRFCREGHFELHLQRVAREYRKRMATALHALERWMPSTVSWTRPEGGYTLWLDTGSVFPGRDALSHALSRQRVDAMPGRHFFTSEDSWRFLRLSIATLDDDEIEEGVRRLGAALGEAGRNRT